MTIKIKVAKAKRVNGFESLFISFPYNQELVNLMREQPSRFWHKESKEWEVPANRLPSLLPLLGKRHIVIEGMVKGKQETINLPDGFTFKTEPYSYQKEGVEYGLNKDSFILGDEQGLGKTKQVIDLAIARSMQKPFAHTLIICGVNGLKWNWRSEIAKHSNETGYILGTRYRKRSGREYDGGNQAKLEDLHNLPKDFFLITNVESLRSKEIADKIAQLAKQGVIGMIAFDEIHKCFEYNTPILTDKGYLKIGDIVTKKLEVNVASYNEATGEIEYKPITGYFENMVSEPFMELTFETSTGIKRIRCTQPHKFFTRNRGWVTASQLNELDDIVEISH